MGNVLEKAKQEQVIALGRLGWSLRRIEAATGVRRETPGGYLRSAGIMIGIPGGWRPKAPADAAPSVTTGSASSKPANEVITSFSQSRPADDSKLANELITGFLPEMRLPEQGGKRPSRAGEVYRELIELRCRGVATRWVSGRIWSMSTGIPDREYLELDRRVLAVWSASDRSG